MALTAELGTTDAEAVSRRSTGPSGEPAAHAPRAEAGQWAAARLLPVDNLKVLLIGAIIAGHGLGGYTAIEAWGYADVRETTLSPITEGALLAVLMPFALFMIPLLFLIAGLLTPPSLSRKGDRAFVRDRLLRLGVPFAVFSLLLWPALLFALYRPLGNAPSSYWDELVGTSEEALDTGYLWFVGDLLLFSLAYVAWVRLRGGPALQKGPRQVRLAHLVALAGAVAVTTFLARLVFPFDSEKWVDLNLYQWPECVAMFALGVVASAQGWLRAVPDRLRRQCRGATLAAVGAFAVFAGLGAALGAMDQDDWRGGWSTVAFAMAILESALSVFGPVWLLGEAQRHLDRPFRWAGPAASRSAYGAFIVQGFVLIVLAVVLRPLQVPAEVKGLLVAAGGVAGSFGLAWLLVSRVPGVSRIL